MRVAALAAALGLIVLAIIDGPGAASPARYADGAPLGAPAVVPVSPFVLTEGELVPTQLSEPTEPDALKLAPPPIAEPMQTNPDLAKPRRDRDEAIEVRPAQNSAGQIWDNRCNGGPLLYGKMPVAQCPLAPGQSGSTSIRTPASSPLPRR